MSAAGSRARAIFNGDRFSPTAPTDKTTQLRRNKWKSLCSLKRQKGSSI
jgi:hypothetical protein